MSFAAEQTVLEPFFLEGSAGRLFCVYHGPAGGTAPVTGVLLAPPFAEEMNKVRRQATLQARAFAALGYGVLIVDLYGTGDSEGAFADARWDIWCDDLRRGADWLTRRGASSLLLWGIRSGALLATDLLTCLPQRVAGLLLWQPVVSGRGHIKQFLRLRVAADMIAGAGAGAGSTSAILSELEQGICVEVAGYELHPDLVAAMTACELGEADTTVLPQVAWLETVASEGRPILPASRRVIETWQAAGIAVVADTAVGESFWSTPEIAVVPALIDQSCRSIAAASP